MRIKKKQNNSESWKKSKEKLSWAGPLVLVFFGVLWTLQGFKLLPEFLDVQWLGLVLVVLGLSRFAMYFWGYY